MMRTSSFNVLLNGLTWIPDPLFPGHPKGDMEIITVPPEYVSVEWDGEATSVNITEEKTETCFC